MADIVIHISTEELIIWMIEIIFVSFLLLLVEYIIFKRKQLDFMYVARIVLSAILIVFILPVIGAIALTLEFEGRDFYPIGVVLVFAVTAYILYYIADEKKFNKVIPLTLIILAILYLIRQIFDVRIV